MSAQEGFPHSKQENQVLLFFLIFKWVSSK